MFMKVSSFLQKSLTLNMNVGEKNIHGGDRSWLFHKGAGKMVSGLC
ncbi:hypothetical protein T260_02370 [Geobacillus thermopakistaniensis]|uniref:Uncharacterized protein n=1 Tax=Geobacillus thermopakistaniensis (strain MAS1) TaxID=1408282 RepID=A0A7U9JDQ5_GEOTM|nr:hypothetical protein GA8_09555 [Geobacillus sp. A8]ESU73579.1 hypothetical protein T260_02370 [Geobacillus sp. MAS1]